MEQTTASTYEQSAIDFLLDTNTTFKARFKSHGIYFDGDTDTRDIWVITLRNERHKYNFTFGQSIADVGKEPTPYDVLASIEKYDPYSFDSFCSDYGYSIDSRSAMKIYKAVKSAYYNITKLFTEDQIEKLQEIQ